MDLCLTPWQTPHQRYPDWLFSNELFPDSDEPGGALHSKLMPSHSKLGLSPADSASDTDSPGCSSSGQSWSGTGGRDLSYKAKQQSAKSNQEGLISGRLWI